ncbi:MAG: hypothetical protein ACREP6_13590 [Candidatus Binataceae bacterium]
MAVTTTVGIVLILDGELLFDTALADRTPELAADRDPAARPALLDCGAAAVAGFRAALSRVPELAVGGALRFGDD